MFNSLKSDAAMRGWITLVGSAFLLLILFSATLIGATLWGRARPAETIAFLGEQDDNYEIYLGDVATGLVVNLTRDPLQDVSFSWSPDGREMAFVSKRSGRDSLYIMDDQGQNVRFIDTDVAPFAPVWSPDGQWIAFMGNPLNGLADIFVMPISGGEAVNITNTRDRSEANISWSPDSTRIVTAALNPPEVKIFAADGSSVERLTDNGTLPQWSPDGTQLVYRTIRGTAEMRRRNLETGTETTLETGDGTVAWVAPAWSPTGDEVAFVKQINNANLIRVANTGSNDARDYVTGVYGIGGLTWNADATHIAFAAKDSQTSTAQNIYILTLETGDIKRLTTTPSFTSFPAWQPREK
jgi:Tol biopolymer transport system component